MGKIALSVEDKKNLARYFNKADIDVYEDPDTFYDIEAIADEYGDEITIEFKSRNLVYMSHFLTVDDFFRITHRIKDLYLSLTNKKETDIVFQNNVNEIFSDNYEYVVIHYKCQPDNYSTLQSMSVGKYYIAKIKRIISGIQYELVTLNNFKRQSNSPICVNKDSIRFTEYKIDSWEKNYQPIIFEGRKWILNPYTGFIKAYLPAMDLRGGNNIDYALSSTITFSGTSNSVKENSNESEFERIKNQTWEVLKNHPKINIHKTDLKCGMDENYLLL